jgi:tetratricopeptide (TPR) repeat protein
VDFCEYVVKVANEAQSIDSYLKFLSKSLSLVQEHITSGCESYLEKLRDLLHEVLNDNLEFITFKFNQLLKTSAASDLQKDSIPNCIVGVVYSTFGRLVLDFPSGDPKVKVDIAITGYEVMVQALSEEDEILPEGKNKILAVTQESLGDLYSRRELDSKLENLDRAIHHYKSALDIYSLEGHSDVWAANQYKLGGCYRKRAAFSPEYFELTAQCFESAIQFYTREKFPLEWAQIQIAIGDTLCEKLSDNKTENIEAAIKYYEVALEVSVHIGDLVGQVKAIYHLGMAYSERIIGETWRNLDDSISYYKQALTLRSKDEDIYTWFNVKRCLAHASSKNSGGKSGNIEDAITILEEILQISSLEISSDSRMFATMELGVLYYKRIIGSPKENNNKALTNLKLAANFFDLEVSLSGWLIAQLNLSDYYGKLADENRLKNIETSIDILKYAIERCDSKLFPEIWIKLHINLATNYKNRAHLAVMGGVKLPDRDMGKQGIKTVIDPIKSQMK